jgi:O-antigen ligase
LVPYLGYLLIAGISIFVAVNFQDALYDWTKIILFFGFFVLLLHALSLEPEPVKLLTGLVILLAFLLVARGVYEILTVTVSTAFDHQASYFIRAYSSNRNLYSQFLVLCLPFALYGVIRLKGLGKIVALLTSFLILVLSIVLLTRSVWLAIAIATTVSFVILVWKNRLKTIFFGFHKTLLWVASGLLIIVLLYAGFGDFKVFEEQLYWLSNYRFGSSLERVELWGKTLEMSADHLLIGVGQNNWKIVFPSYEILGQREDASTIFFQRPHNDFLWVLSENGFSGLVFYAAIFVLVFSRLIRSLVKNSGQHPFGFFVALLFGLIAYLVFANLSFPKERIEHQVLLHTYFALILLHSSKPVSGNSKLSGQILLLTFVFAGVCLNILLSACRFHSEKDVLRGYEFRERGNYQKVRDNMDKTERNGDHHDPCSNPVYR